MGKKPRLLLFGMSFATCFSTVHAFALEGVVASIKPVHSLVSAVMEGVSEPQLLVSGAGSPHTYSMRPSEAQMLEQAKVVFWIGSGLETFLAKPLNTLAGEARVVTLADTPGLTLLDTREGGTFAEHSHDHAEAHAHDHEEDHDHDESHEHHAHGNKDMHIWLDPENARAMVRQIAATLSDADPENAAAYEENADAVEGRLDALTREVAEALAGVTDRPFVVFHDAYHYFEDRFDLSAAGSITVSPEVLPGAQRLQEIRNKIEELNAACVFSEPQFEPKLVDVVVEGTNARAGVLDPLGADLADGPDLYFTLISNAARSLADCLAEQ